MQFSESIDWKRLDAETNTSNWILTEELFKNHSLQKHFDSDAKAKKNDIEILQGKKKDTLAAPDGIPEILEPQFPYARISNLSIEAQKYFWNTYKDYVCGEKIATVDLNRLQNLIWKVSTEQEEFLRFLQQHSLSTKNDYNLLQPQVGKEIQSTLQAQRRQVEENLDPLYTLFQTVVLSSGAVFPNDPILCYKQTLKQAVGQNLLSLPAEITTRNRSFLDANEIDSPTHIQICQDSTVCAFAGDNASHFVLTAEALQTLIDNHPPDYENDWELPVTVVDQSKDSSKTMSECSKTILIDDPLPPKSVKPRDANIMYYHHKVCNVLRKPWDSHSQTVSDDKEEMQATMDLDNDLTVKEDHLESRVENLQSCSKDDEVKVNMTCKNGNVIADEVKLTEFESKERKNKSCQSLTEGQYTYSMWTFGSLNLLIRSQDCGLLYQSSKAGKGSLHAVNVFIKPEYQLTFGYEQITTSEASRWWINTYVNPDSLCVCARIDPATAQLLRLDVLNQSSILTLSSFDPAKPMKMVHGVLTRLEKLLQPGKYILSHSAKDMHICVYEVMDVEDGRQGKKASYDLHRAHSNDREVLVNYEKYVPWVPVDPNMFLDWHIAHHRIPLTFPPVSKEELKKLQGQNAGVGRKNKKGKKTKTSGIKGKRNVKQTECKQMVSTKMNKNQIKKLFHSDEQAEKQEDTSISQRLRSGAVPVTYDDIDFDF